MKKNKISPVIIGVAQATGLIAYCAAVGAVMLNGNRWFGPTPSFLGPMLFLTLFVFSAIVCAAMFLGYPFYLFWEKKDLPTAFKVIASSTVTLFVFVLLTLTILSLVH
ncbi:MAG: hypothetical protein M1484_00275 [Patescibacteria group bacterium]|nr:hypothetical protein [Patescibacteria group bacterium]MCL5431517.1 hypothetical protein [Patescibacteria group bacterium]